MSQAFHRNYLTPLHIVRSIDASSVLDLSTYFSPASGVFKVSKVWQFPAMNSQKEFIWEQIKITESGLVTALPNSATLGKIFSVTLDLTDRNGPNGRTLIQLMIHDAITDFTLTPSKITALPHLDVIKFDSIATFENIRGTVIEQVQFNLGWDPTLVYTLVGPDAAKFSVDNSATNYQKGRITPKSSAWSGASPRLYSSKYCLLTLAVRVAKFN